MCRLIETRQRSRNKFSLDPTFEKKNMYDIDTKRTDYRSGQKLCPNQAGKNYYKSYFHNDY